MESFLSQRPSPAFSLDRLATGAEEKPDVFLEGEGLPALPSGGSARFPLSTDTLTDVRSPASAPCGWPMLRALVLTSGQIRSVSLLSLNHEEQLPQPCRPQCLPGLLLLLASRENSWPAGAARCSR